jgi:hypothetical protein
MLKVGVGMEVDTIFERVAWDVILLLLSLNRSWSFWLFGTMMGFALSIINKVSQKG